MNPVGGPTEMRCWVCESTDAAEWKPRSLDRPLEANDLRITDSRYGLTLALRRCKDCGFVFAEDDDLSRLDELYAALDDPGYEESQEPRSLQMRWLVDLARGEAATATTALDVGAGTGVLVAEADRAGLEAVGVEPSRSLVAVGTAKHGVTLYQGVLPHPALTDRRFDLVFLIDVIEHVSDPVQLLRECEAVLGEGGTLVVVTPDVSSGTARLLGRRWWHLRLAHVGYFSDRSFRTAAERAGLQVVRSTRARWFFRVSYLADRATAYVPVGWLNRIAQKVAPLRWLYARVIRVNLHDSTVFLARR